MTTAKERGASSLFFCQTNNKNDLLVPKLCLGTQLSGELCFQEARELRVRYIPQAWSLAANEVSTANRSQTEFGNEGEKQSLVTRAGNKGWERGNIRTTKETKITEKKLFNFRTLDPWQCYVDRILFGNRPLPVFPCSKGRKMLVTPLG